MNTLFEIEQQIYNISHRLQDRLKVMFNDMEQHLSKVEKHIIALEEKQIYQVANNIIEKHKLLTQRANDRLKWLAYVDLSLSESLLYFLDQVEEKYYAQIIVDLTPQLDTIPISNQQILLNLLVDVVEGKLEDHTIDSIYLKIYVQDNDLWIIFRDNGMGTLPQMHSQVIWTAISAQLEMFEGRIDQRIVAETLNETNLIIPLKINESKANRHINM